MSVKFAGMTALIVGMSVTAPTPAKMSTQVSTMSQYVSKAVQTIGAYFPQEYNNSETAYWLRHLPRHVLK